MNEVSFFQRTNSMLMFNIKNEWLIACSCRKIYSLLRHFRYDVIHFFLDTYSTPQAIANRFYYPLQGKNKCHSKQDWNTLLRIYISGRFIFTGVEPKYCGKSYAEMNESTSIIPDNRIKAHAFTTSRCSKTRLRYARVYFNLAWSDICFSPVGRQ